jgi:hypothetical protein
MAQTDIPEQGQQGFPYLPVMKTVSRVKNLVVLINQCNTGCNRADIDSQGMLIHDDTSFLGYIK